MTATTAEPLHVERLRLVDIRTYHRSSLELSSRVTLLVGPNGVGKTNALEACATVLSGSSPRTSAELRLVRDGAAAGSIHADVRRGTHHHQREVRFDPTRGKLLLLDGQATRSAEQYAAAAPCCVFLPERLLVVRGAPARRRMLVDQLTARLDHVAADSQRRYARALTQRGALLRRAKAGHDVHEQAAPWTAQLVEHGTRLREQRHATLAALAPRFRDRLSQLTGMAEGTFELVPRGGDDLQSELAASWDADVRRGSTTVGPHLDDVLPRDAGRDLRAFGSTGEQRATLLAFTLASSDVLRDRMGVQPVLLLDEPWAELDADRRRRLSAALADAGQVLATTTEPPQHLLQDSSPLADVDIRRVSSGRIDAWTTSTPPHPETSR